MLPDFFISTSEAFDVIVDSTFTDCAIMKDFRFADTTIKNMTLPISNLGFGAAKYLKLEWDIDYDAITEKLEDTYGEQNTLKIEASEAIISDYSALVFQEITYICKEDTLISMGISPQKVSFLAPSTDKNLFNEMDIPIDFVKISLYNQQKFRETKIKAPRIGFPLIVTYQNIAGKNYKKIYNIDIGCSGHWKWGGYNISFNIEEITT